MIKELLKKSRSYRGYDESVKVTKDQLMEFVDCARYAPSSVNMQPLKYRLVYGEEVSVLQPLTKWARALPNMTLPHPGHCPTAFIVICQDQEIAEAIPRFQKDVGIVAQSMLLAATEMGLGGCMIGNFNAGEVREALSLPEKMAPVLVVAFGKPDEKIVLTEIAPGESTDYYRDAQDVHLSLIHI